MNCPAVITGDQFIVRVLAHIDCQAQVLGSYGYQALGEPGSLASTIMLGLLTIFIALLGYRLLFGPTPGARDIVGDVITIGIVLTIAFSWPAFRTLIYDVALQAPAEIAASITAPSIGEGDTDMARRLQRADNAMVRLNAIGMGRNTGAFIEGTEQGSSFEGSTQADESILGFARMSFVSGIIASLAFLRLAAGLLLALAPLAAGLLLFEQTRGLFSGWIRGLVLALIGSVGASVILSAQLGIIEPWLSDALRVRQSGYATPAAPIELFALNFAFAILQFVMIWFLAKIAFTRGWIRLPTVRSDDNSQSKERSTIMGSPIPIEPRNRAERIADNVSSLVRREQSFDDRRTSMRVIEQGAAAGRSATMNDPSRSVQQPRLGTAYRRTHSRGSRAASQRDSRK